MNTPSPSSSPLRTSASCDPAASASAPNSASANANVCVFCSAAQVDQVYIDAVHDLGKTLGGAGYNLVFGGFSEGLMGVIADGFSAAGAQVTGVVPVTLENNGRDVHDACGTVIEVDALQERKKVMIERSDAFVVAPGGIGTLDEFFAVLAMKMVGESDAPIVLLNTQGFYEPLDHLLEKMQSAGFLHRPLENLIYLADSPADVLAYLNRELGQ